MKEVVVTHNLTKRFGTFTAVDQVNISIGQGEIYGFVGPNGAGKSTVIRMLCGILEPTAGSGTVLGYDLVRDTEQIKKRIGYMSQKFSLYNDLTVGENLSFYAGIYQVNGAKKKKRIEEMTEMAGLKGREKELAANLSSGWRQRLALGCALISRPSLVFLDEPTSGVSPTSRRIFFSIIEDLAQAGTTVMVTTHFMDEAERCHKIAFISAGRLIAADTPENLKKHTLRGCLVELVVPDAIERINGIEALPYVKDCNIYGPLLHVLLESKEKMADLAAFTGVQPKEIIPSLEDVFVTLSKIQREGEENA